MRRNRLAILSIVLATSAWAVGIAGVYLFFDLGSPYDESLLRGFRVLERYWFWLSTCPSVLFLVGSIAAVVTGYFGVKQSEGSGGSQGGSLLAWMGVILGAMGMGVGSLLVLGVAYFVFLLYMMTAHGHW